MPEGSDGSAFVALRFLEGHPEEAARQLEAFSPADAASLLAEAPADTAGRVLRCTDPPFAVACLAELPAEHAGATLDSLPLGVAAALLRRMPEEVRSVLLGAAPEGLGQALAQLLRYPEGTAGSLMNPRILSFAADLSVADAVARLRRTPPDDLYYLYVVDREQKLVGVATYRMLLIAEPDAQLAAVMHQPVTRLGALDRGEALIAHPGWRVYLALPVADEGGVLVGALHRDVLLEHESDRLVPSGVPAAGAALSVAEAVWLGLSRTLGGLLGSGAPPTSGPGETAPRSPNGRNPRDE